MTFIDFLNQNNGIVIGNKKCGIVEYKILDDNVYNEEGIEYYTLSPITAYRTIENKKTEYLSPDSSDFRDYIISNLAKKYYLCFHENMDEIDIIDISNVKKKIVKFRKTFVISYHMRIKFGKLNTKIQKVILTCGLGGKNSYGLGMVSKRVR
jgi:CRISPR-associated endoribonuclease Cas6